MEIKFKNLKFIAICSLILPLLYPTAESYATGNGNIGEVQTETGVNENVQGEVSESEAEEKDNVRALYQEYRSRFESIEYTWDISDSGFEIVDDQIFPIELNGYGEVSVVPAFEKEYSRLALFFADENGKILYKTDQLETNNRVRGQMKQPNRGIAAISFQDVNNDMRMDVVLITSCVNDSGEYAGKPYKVGEVLFQSKKGVEFYRDYRISDKINRFGMNKSVEAITAFVRDGYSTEFMYTATTLCRDASGYLTLYISELQAVLAPSGAQVRQRIPRVASRPLRA